MARSLLVNVLLRGGERMAPTGSYFGPLQEAMGLVMQLIAGADFGLGAKGTCLWLGPGHFRPVTYVPWATTFLQLTDTG